MPDSTAKKPSAQDQTKEHEQRLRLIRERAAKKDPHALKGEGDFVKIEELKVRVR